MKKIIVNKGYTVEVTSWENDGDNYRTKSKTYETIEEAKLIRDLCKDVFRSNTNNCGGIGNLMEDDESIATPIIVEFLIHNPSIVGLDVKDLVSKIRDEYSETSSLQDNECLQYAGDYYSDNNIGYFERYIEDIMEINYELMGGSEYYYSRICETVVIYHSPEDVFLDIIQ